MNNTLLSLLQLSDPALPVGGYAHSAGLETYVQNGSVSDVPAAAAFVQQMLLSNLRYTDGAFVSLAYDAALQADFAELLALHAHCSATKLPEEMRMASGKMGLRLLKIFAEFPRQQLAKEYLLAKKEDAVAAHYCIAFGIIAAASGISKQEMLQGFFYNAASGFVTNCVKLVPLGQQDGQRILFGLQPVIAACVAACIQPDEAMIGVCCPAFEIAQMQHETLYSRLYMS